MGEVYVGGVGVEVGAVVAQAVLEAVHVGRYQLGLGLGEIGHR